MRVCDNWQYEDADDGEPAQLAPRAAPLPPPPVNNASTFPALGGGSNNNASQEPGKPPPQQQHHQQQLAMPHDPAIVQLGPAPSNNASGTVRPLTSMHCVSARRRPMKFDMNFVCMGRRIMQLLDRAHRTKKRLPW
jgi:hypothetical protein